MQYIRRVFKKVQMEYHDKMKVYLGEKRFLPRLSVILALIAILNFINLTYTSIHERKQELKVLGAIGMTKKQIAAMLSYEGIFRVLLTFALVLTIGQLLNYVIVYLMAGEMIMFSYKYVVWPMFACIPVFLVIAAAIPRTIGNSKKLLLKR